MTLYKSPPSGLTEVRRNGDVNPRAISTGSMAPFGARNGWVRTFTTGVTPTELPFVSVARFTSGEAGSVAGRGVDSYGSVGDASPGTTGDWIAGPTVTPGQSLCLSRYARSNVAGSFGFRLRVRFHDGAGNWVGALMDGDYTPSGVGAAWHRPFWSGVVPAGATRVTVRTEIRTVTVTTATFIDVTGLLADLGSASLRDHFDGSYVNTPAVFYYWAGTTNASASVQAVPAAADTLEPLLTLGPWEASRENRSIVHQLLHDGSAVFTYMPPAKATGSFGLLFDGYAAADAAMTWLTGSTAYYIDAEIAGGRLTKLFLVMGDDITIEQDENVPSKYVLTVPWQEATG